MPTAVRVHESAGRFRLRVPERRGDAAWFEHVEGVLREHLSVREVRTSPLTGSVVVRHRGARDAIEAWAKERGLFDVRPAPRPTTTNRIWEQLSSVNRGLVSKDPELKLNALLFYSLLGGTVLQIARGSFLPAGEALLLQMLGVLSKAERDVAERAREDGVEQGDGVAQGDGAQGAWEW